MILAQFCPDRVAPLGEVAVEPVSLEDLVRAVRLAIEETVLVCRPAQSGRTR